MKLSSIFSSKKKGNSDANRWRKAILGSKLMPTQAVSENEMTCSFQQTSGSFTRKHRPNSTEFSNESTKEEERRYSTQMTPSEVLSQLERFSDGNYAEAKRMFSILRQCHDSDDEDDEDDSERPPMSEIKCL